MIYINKSPTADTRTCDFAKVKKEQLLKNTEQHIDDVKQGVNFITTFLIEQAKLHDWDKIENIDRFYSDFKTGFKKKTWWENHKKVSRHHLSPTGHIPENVNLMDVLEYIVDCVMAGSKKWRSIRAGNRKGSFARCF